MKKIRLIGVVCMIAALAAGCGTQKEENAENVQSAEERYAEGDSLKQAGLGALAILYDDSVWTYDESQGGDSGMAFTAKDGSLLGISCSKETLYQHPLDMINISSQLNAAYEGFTELEAPTPVTVQGEEWYEWIYRYEEDGVSTIALQRFYSKNYYAYTMSYIVEEKNYEANRNEALKVMNSAVMSVPDNAENEQKAAEFLVGEWDLGESGWLVLHDDFTYEWYQDGSKDEKNMHKGTYSGDVANETFGFTEGEGVYLVLFPEVLYADGKEGRTANAKYDYAISLEQQPDGTYQMINASTFAMYSMTRKK